MSNKNINNRNNDHTHTATQGSDSHYFHTTPTQQGWALKIFDTHLFLTAFSTLIGRGPTVLCPDWLRALLH